MIKALIRSLLGEKNIIRIRRLKSSFIAAKTAYRTLSTPKAKKTASTCRF